MINRTVRQGVHCSEYEHNIIVMLLTTSKSVQCRVFAMRRNKMNAIRG